MDYTACSLCPRECYVNRTAGELGFCKCPDTALVAKAMLHKWEEPVLAGDGGSGAIFFGGCTLGCRYCQNYAISRCPTGKAADSAELRKIMEAFIAQGAENIDLVTPTQFLPTILPALSPKLPVPVVYNCGGYERVETLQQLEGNLIYPKVVGNSVGLPSIWVLMAVSLGGSLFGVPGMLFFIPLLATVYTLLRENVNVRNARKEAGTVGEEEKPDDAEINDEEIAEGETGEK